MHPMLLRTALLLTIAFLSGLILAQSPRTYTTQQYNLDLINVDSVFRDALSLLERESSASYYYDEEVEELTVPIVFHVLHTSLFNRVDEEQIRSQIEILNQDFNTLNLPDEDPRDPDGTFRGLAAAPGIQFCSPVTNPGGELTSGINYRLIPSGLLGNLLGIKESIFGIAPWNARRHLNVWVVDLPEGIGGFAQLPGGNPLTDGIVIDPQYLGLSREEGAPYGQGRTLTHLIGNYLGLKDLWGRGGCEDDGVRDTPVHNAPNIGVPGRGHTSTCDGYPAEMSMNFMDNTDDAGVYMFTKGQVKRMRWVLSRDGLRADLAQTETECERQNLMPEAESKSPVPLVEPAAELSFKVWPNPAQENFTISINSSGTEGKSGQSLRILDLSGRIIHQETVAAYGGQTSKVIDASSWVPGGYLVKVMIGDKSETKKVVVQ
ncbi:zinc-dependent metalloprotease [Neolewinella agarilytica]|uniref:zinc-dependent metalloprotease n=1 Tax=Neolewinella agarilytica TaxID=478744 RepID=UPI0023574BDD|nr:zinc-dependent metalloprotease [Neolewinella agarilytica]